MQWDSFDTFVDLIYIGARRIVFILYPYCVAVRLPQANILFRGIRVPFGTSFVSYLFFISGGVL